MTSLWQAQHALQYLPDTTDNPSQKARYGVPRLASKNEMLDSTALAGRKRQKTAGILAFWLTTKESGQHLSFAEQNSKIPSEISHVDLLNSNCTLPACAHRDSCEKTFRDCIVLAGKNGVSSRLRHRSSMRAYQLAGYTNQLRDCNWLGHMRIETGFDR
jgi:hypothetical protein